MFPIVTPGPIIHEALSMLSASLLNTITIEQHIAPDCGVIFVDLTSIHHVVIVDDKSTLIEEVSEKPANAHIFVIDDEPSIAKVMSRLLE